jgi:hypothetical protein
LNLPGTISNKVVGCFSVDVVFPLVSLDGFALALGAGLLILEKCFYFLLKCSQISFISYCFFLQDDGLSSKPCKNPKAERNYD